MHRVIELDRAAFAALPPVGTMSAPSAAMLALTAADAFLAVRADGGRIVARAAVWWNDAPLLDGVPVGRVGHFATEDEGAAIRLLDAARALLHARGHNMAVGPLDGSTWFSYRFVVDARGVLAEPRAPFALEPAQPAEWPDLWTRAGWHLCARYHSSVVQELAAVDAPSMRARLDAHGISLRPLDPRDWSAELDRLYDVAAAAFAAAPLASPITRERFHQLYTPFHASVQPDLVLFAERDGEAVGFGFAYPDMTPVARGGAVDTVVIKTVAVHPARRVPGLGGVLVNELHARARALGYRQAIHALMHDDNVGSTRLSARFGVPMRRYALFAAPTAA
ncbi:MAG: GNAT family N-acetyltransferase [Gemmatimonadaceae bacterium]|nr:GNAT family N-acetyltransferase [Gemmatimonadaceae bacterium]